MLSASPDYLQLLRHAGNPLYAQHESLLPPVPLAPFSFAVVGRLTSLSQLKLPSALMAAVKQVSVKTAVKKAAGGIDIAPAALAAITREADAPPFVAEMVAHLAGHPDDRSIRYLLLEDRLHPNCFPAEDHLLLTELGFMRLSDVQTHFRRHATLRVACPRADGSLEFHDITQADVVTHEGHHEHVCMEAPAGNSAHERGVCLLPTTEHRMWTRSAHDDSELRKGTFAFRTAGELLETKNDAASNVLQLQCSAPLGVAGLPCSALPFAAPLALTSDQQVHAFLQLYGLWLRDRDLQQLGATSIVFEPRTPDEQQRLEALLARLPLSHIHSLSPDVHGWWRAQRPDGRFRFGIVHLAWEQWLQNDIDSSDVGLLPAWTQLLGRDQLRSLLAGLSSSKKHDSLQVVPAAGTVVATSVPARDQVMLAALRAGYSAHFTSCKVSAGGCPSASTATLMYHVHFSSEESASAPQLTPARDLHSASLLGTVWCVMVPTHERLCMFSRALRCEGGEVIEQSPAVVVGNSISRFHFLVKRERVAAAAAAPAAAAVAAPAATSYRYLIKDLGSLNGLYIDDVRVPHGNWLPLREGALLRFAPQTRTAKAYIAAFHEAAEANARNPGSRPKVPRVPDTPLAAKDMHAEYVFNHRIDEACLKRIAELEVSVPDGVVAADVGEDDARPAARNFRAPGAAVAAARGALLAAAREAVPPAPAPGSREYHQNSALLDRQREADARNAAFYRRFASPAVAAGAAAPAVADPVIDDEELNAAPVPSNFREVDARARLEESARLQRAAERSALNAHMSSLLNVRPAGKRAREEAASAAAPAAGAAAASAGAAASASVERTPKRARSSGRMSAGMSAYVAYGKEHRASIRAELAAAHPSLDARSLFAQTTRELASRWNQLTVEQKAVYQASADQQNESNGGSARARAGAGAGAVSDSMDDIAEHEHHHDEHADEDGDYVPSVLPQQRANAERRSGLAAAAAASASSAASAAASSAVAAAAPAGRAPRDVVELLDDDEDMPLSSYARSRPVAVAPSSPAVAPAAAAAASSVSPAAAAAAASAEPSPAPAAHGPALVNPAFASLLEEYTCGVCADLIYQCVVLDCSHSYCKGCIVEWFKKKKVCPVCRERHKGAPRAVRVADNTIDILVQQCLTSEAKAERLERIARVDALQKEIDARKAEKEHIKNIRAAVLAAAAAQVPADDDEEDDPDFVDE